MMTIAIHRKLPAPARQHARREPLHDQRGQSAVEITLLLPLLLVLLFGILLSGFTFYAFIQVSNAAREGARAGSEYRITQASNNWASLNDPVRKAIYDTSASPPTSALGYLSPTPPSFNVTSSDVTTTSVDVDGDGVISAGDQLKVTVTYRYTLPLVSALLPMFPQPIVIVRSVMMEIQ